MDTLQQAFHLEEYKQIRAEIGVLLARVENLFRYSLVVTATIYAWLLVQSVGLTSNGQVCLKLPVLLLRPGWLIPPAFVLLSGLLAFAAYWRIGQMGDYLKRIESDMGTPALGWEKFLSPKKPVVTSTTIIVWILLFAASCYGTLQGLGAMKGEPPACKIESLK